MAANKESEKYYASIVIAVPTFNVVKCYAACSYREKVICYYISRT